ncbi:selenocysteine-specific translation elongation factor [Alkalibacter mobilis]|uniref:selenocysteine-specific translation elongation factor n=1 Tax=Alkalibacter mobilis TaxID=2787712 RepID=UPI0018A06F1A|nr:selenocysteine-specific translation elongation factor [Alkalibacter mobilis]MBF7096786.1 selenocysteine-specific translation elongation factor [Alkalibacter mobilis]
MKHITLGTAGHIDHGKTALVKILTGADTDRLKEEKIRGMTIELGFAHMEVPSGSTVSIIDVPGHEKFIKTMVAGITGIDFVILVVAADEGIMPQTREHLDILSVLGVNTGFVALTKSDLVDKATIFNRQKEIATALKETSLDGIDIIPVSSITGEGVESIINKIDELTIKSSKNSYQSLFRLPVDRVFTITGHGTIVTGTVSGGIIKKGDTVEILPEGLSSKVRSIQVRNNSVTAAIAGDRCALNLSGIEKQDIKRGTVVIEKDMTKPVSLMDAVVHMVPGSVELIHNQRVHLHTGTTTVIARIRMLNGDSIEEGSKGYVQLRLEEPIVALRGDRFIIRSYSPVKTIGGGTILFHKTKSRKRFDPKSFEMLQIAESENTRDLLETIVFDSKGLFNLESLYKTTLLDRDLIKKILDGMIKEGTVRYLSSSGNYLNKTWYDEIVSKINEELEIFFKKHPYRYRMLKEEIKNKILPDSSAKEFEELADMLIEEEKFKIDSQYFEPIDKTRLQSIKTSREINTIKGIFLNEDHPVWTISQVSEKVKIPQKTVEEILRFLSATQILVEVEPGSFVSANSINLVYNLVVSQIKTHGAITVAQLRDILNTSRKSSIYFLEYFDSIGVTVRLDNDRVPGPNFDKFRT